MTNPKFWCSSRAACPLSLAQRVYFAPSIIFSPKLETATNLQKADQVHKTQSMISIRTQLRIYWVKQNSTYSKLRFAKDPNSDAVIFSM